MTLIVSDQAPAFSEAASAPLAITLFGPMQVFVHGALLAPLRSRKALWLLALLALRHDRPVEREWLAETLWPDSDLDKSLSSLRATLSDLRKSLGIEGKRLQSLNRRALCLHLAGATVDVIAFDAAVKSGNLSQTPKLSVLEQVVALYAGPLLEGCAEEWAIPERAEREENCLQALQALAEAALAVSDGARAARFFRQAISLDPWREGAQRGLMEALAQIGDSNGAIQVYREFISLLRSDPKAVPDEQTSALYRRLRLDARRQAVAGSVDPKEETAPAVSGYLPHALTEMIGREDERLDVAERLRHSRLVTLTGPGGIGKTRLAVQVAADTIRKYADGVWLVALESLTDGGQITGQIAGVLGLKEPNREEPRFREQSDRFSLRVLTDSLRTKHLLLVLDNCEHLLEESAHVAGRLLQECGGVRILATSRAALGVTGETIWGVPSLSVPDPQHLPEGQTTLLRVLSGYEGVRLFVERAQAAQKDFALTADNARAVALVCARLGGLPLAIELAAARVRAMDVGEMAERLDNHLSLLVGGSRGAQPRQQTLRATLDWSHALLTVQEQLLLARLSVFAGGWTLEAVEAICLGKGIEESLGLDLLTSLVDKSLVTYRTHHEESPAHGRYHLLETVRQYAWQRLEASGEADRIQVRRCDFFLHLSDEAASHLIGGAGESWRRRLQVERDNLRAALDWCEAEAQRTQGAQGAEEGLRLAGALFPYWLLNSDFREGRMYLQRALAWRGSDAALAARGAAMKGAAVLADRNGDYTSARALYEQALSVFRQVGDAMTIASMLGSLNNLAHRQDDLAAAEMFCEEAKALYEERLNTLTKQNDRKERAAIFHYLALLANSQGDYVRSQAMCHQSLSLRRELG